MSAVPYINALTHDAKTSFIILLTSSAAWTEKHAYHVMLLLGDTAGEQKLQLEILHPSIDGLTCF